MQCWAGWALVTDLYALEACEKEQSKVRVQDESGRYSAKTVKFFFFFSSFYRCKREKTGEGRIHGHLASGSFYQQGQVWGEPSALGPSPG